MSLLSDLNDKIKALSARVAAQFKTQQSAIDSKVSNVTLSGKTLTVTKGDGTTSTYTTTDTNTTYKAGTGLSLSSTTFSLAASGATAGSYGPSANASPAHKGTFSVPYITVDATGRVTDISTKTITLPADNNTTYSNMTAATADAAGKAGLVPAPAAGAQGKYLRGDGTWQTPPNTTYKAGTGLSLSSTTFSLAASGATAGSYGPSANASPAHKGTFSVPYITVDATGRVTDISTKTITLPADNNTTYSNMTAATADAAGKAGLVPAPAAGAQGKYLRGDGTWQTPANTKVTNTVSNTKKFYITGTSSSSTNTGTQYFDTGVYVTATAGYLHCTRLEVGSGTIWVA